MAWKSHRTVMKHYPDCGEQRWQIYSRIRLHCESNSDKSKENVPRTFPVRTWNISWWINLKKSHLVPFYLYLCRARYLLQPPLTCWGVRDVPQPRTSKTAMRNHISGARQPTVELAVRSTFYFSFFKCLTSHWTVTTPPTNIVNTMYVLFHCSLVRILIDNCHQ